MQTFGAKNAVSQRDGLDIQAHHRTTSINILSCRMVYTLCRRSVLVGGESILLLKIGNVH